MITTCIFDLDGTLVDSLEDLGTTCNTVLQQYGFSIHPLVQYRTFVGDGVDMLIQRALPKEQQSLTKELRVVFDKLYTKHCLDHTKPYPGVLELIEKLSSQGIQLVVVTNKPDAMAKKIVDTLFGNQFQYIYGNDPKYPRKPNPYFVYKVIEQLQVTKEEVLYIGDSDVDVLTGKNAGIKVMGVSWGFRGKQELLDTGADVVVDYPSEIGVWIDDCN